MLKLGAYLTILFISFIGFIGISIPFPTMIMIFLDAQSPFMQAGTAHEWRNFVTGCGLATYPLMQAFGSPLVGQLSDRYGRKKVLLISMSIAALAYALTSFAVLSGVLLLFFVGRMICGLVQGNIAIAMSTAGDLSSGATKKKLFAQINAAAYLAFLIGPKLGGFLANQENGAWCGFHLPFAISAVCMAVAVLVSLAFFPKMAPVQKNLESFSLLSEFRAIKGNLRNEKLRPYFIMAVFLFLGINIFLEFNNVFFVSAFDLNVAEVGNFVSYFSIFSISAQLCFNFKIFQRFSSANMLGAAILGLLCALTMLAFANDALYIWLFLPLAAVSFAVAKTSFQLLVSDNTAQDKQGGSIGLAEGLDVFCDAIAAIGGGILAGLHLRLPLMTAAVAIFLAFVLLMYLKTASQKRENA